jgi:predicted permease
VGAVTISPLTLAILESNTGGHDTYMSFLRAIKRPVVWAPILAVVLVALNFNVPSYIERSLGLFAVATAGAALFLTGLVLSAQRFRFNWSVGWSVVGKTLLQPALCLGAARAVGLTPEQTRHAVLITAIPCGFFGVVFGKSFETRAEVASSSLIASTLVGIVTLAAWIVFLS